MATAQYSDRNIGNSLSLVLAAALLTDGYLLYWHAIDAVQTPDQWYYNYSAQQTTYLADTTFAARVANAKGLLTLVPALSAIPRLLVRPTISGVIASGQEFVPIPALSIEIGPLLSGANYQMGDSETLWRARVLTISAFGRDLDERNHLSDILTLTLAKNLVVDIHDHEAGDLAVIGDVQVMEPSVDCYTSFDEAEATTYEVLYTARLEFVS